MCTPLPLPRAVSGLQGVERLCWADLDGNFHLLATMEVTRIKYVTTLTVTMVAMVATSLRIVV